MYYMYMCFAGGLENIKSMSSPEPVSVERFTVAVYVCYYAYLGW
jgi:hypothetical protein